MTHITNQAPHVPFRALANPELRMSVNRERHEVAVQTHSDDCREEARRLLAGAAMDCVPIGAAGVGMWLFRLNFGVAVPLAGDEFKKRATTISMVLEDFPKACFTDETLKDALLVLKHFPGAAELAEVLTPTMHDLRWTLKALKRIAEPPALPPPPCKPESREERERLLAESRARWRANLAGS